MVTRAELKPFVQNLKAEFLRDPNVPIERLFSAAIDDVIREIWSGRSAPVPFALMAVGGYGRGTIHPESDIDLLFYFRDSVHDEIVNGILNPMWDLPFRLGQQIRQASDFKAFDQGQMESYTAFLDARFLVGDPALAGEFDGEVLPSLIGSNRDSFLRALVEMKAQRYGRFGDTVFQLEPDLKDVPGGLRDFHWSDWVRKALQLNGGEGRAEELIAFHHSVRNFLHCFSGRNFNVLTYEFQEQIAPRLGYKDSEHGEAAENLMRDYFLKAGEISRRAADWEERIVGSPNRFAVTSNFSDPFEMLDAFAEAHRRKARLDPASLSAIRQRVAEMTGDALTNNPRAGRIVLDMMKDREGIYDALLTMHDVGLLGKVFPDFEEIRCRVIRDFFHKYTVDEHSLIAIRNIEELQTPPHNLEHSRQRLSGILNELENPELLLLGLLFHDIGKAHRHDEGNHVHPSVEGVKGILQKLELPGVQIERVVAVIQNHLEMSKIIMRRDFSDDHVIGQFADLVGSVENLRMLCLLTYADVKAVNNEVLTPWKEDLLWQLYVETYNRLTLGLADDQYNQQPALESDIEAIRSFAGESAEAQDIRDFLDGFPRRYLKNTPKEKIAEHFRLSRELAERPMIMHLGRTGSIYELLVMTGDRPFLFSKITGVLTYFGMNILHGQAFSNSHGTIFDLIAFEDIQAVFEKNPSEIDRMSKVLGDVVAGKQELDKLLRPKMTSVFFRRKRGFVPTTIHFDNEFARRCTIMEIVTQDDFGLLYRISSVISSHGCNIEVALITTEGNRAIDVFYITKDGGKVSNALEKDLEADLDRVLAAVY